MAVFKVITEIPDSIAPYVPLKKYHDENSILQVIEYCLNPDKIPSRFIGGFVVCPVEDAVFQMECLARSYCKAQGLRLRHMILSFQDGELTGSKHPTKRQLELAAQIAFQIANYYANRYQIIYAVHEDTRHVHIHFIMNTVSYVDGLKYTGKKQDYYMFRTYIKEVLRPYGIQLVPI